MAHRVHFLLGEGNAMLELIKACYEIRSLRGRLGLGLELQPADEVALVTLERLFGPPGGVGAARRLETRVALVFKHTDGRLAEGKLTDVSATGAFVETQSVLPVGTETVLRIRDEHTLREYHFAAQVVRTTRRGMGLRLVGIPVECRYHVPAEELARAA